MTREQIDTQILSILEEKFEIVSPGMDDDLREKHNFDSIDAIELLVAIEDMLGRALSPEEKKPAMEIRTIREICSYVEGLG
ncbi:MAG TPA: phosphopantetheine-binding protein [Myxococcota bacterium]|nr:phosphopantetheine-binding protein [Myxococcota bacterium]HRY96016.1 phosphopantetheine-binding protein [Myxococcota bacterium]HSA23006.1 phosphopantetheine-binding protein [Myxococcota bacterium]